MVTNASSAEFFEAKYREHDDPWNFAESAYESARYDAIMAALAGKRYARAFEPGCSVGVLTQRLAEVCGSLTAVDGSSSAVARAAARCAGCGNVRITCAMLPAGLPEGEFDLIVFSEIGYYFDREALREVAELLVSRLRPGGTLLAEHWLGVSADHVLSGDAVHEVLETVAGLRRSLSERHAGFRLERWERE